MKLFRVTCWYNSNLKEDTFESFVIAENKVEAEKIVKESVWTLGGMEVKSISEVDMSTQKVLVSIDSKDLEQEEEE